MNPPCTSANLYENFLPKMDKSGGGTNNYECFRIMSIINPSKFYVVEDHPDVNWLEDMQNFYQNLSTDLQKKLRINIIDRVYQHEWYVWKDQDDLWHRVRVVKVSGSKIRVCLVDIDVFKLVSINDMMKIDDQFVDKDFLYGFCAHLIGIQPPGNATTWSEEATNTFRKNCPFRKKFLGINLGQKNNKCGLILLQKCYNPRFRFSLQWTLLSKGLADCCFSFVAGRRDLAHVITGPPSYDQHEMQKTLTVDELDLFFTSKIPNRFGQHYGSLFPNFWPNSSPINQNDLSTAAGLKEKNVACIVITAVAPGGPSTFYIQMRQDSIMLEQMMTDLEKIVSSQKALPFAEVKAGDIVAAKVGVFNKTVSYWTRAVIKSVQSKKDKKGGNDDSVDVILIDFGMEKGNVPMHSLRELPKYFLTVTPFCQRAHIGISIKVSLRTTQQVMNGWAKESVKLFKEYVNFWKFREPSWHAWQSNNMPKGVELQQFNQDLFFEKGRWYPRMPQMNSPYAAIDRRQNDPLLRPFFTSIGLNLVRKTGMMMMNPPYHFEPILDLLQNKMDSS